MFTPVNAKLLKGFLLADGKINAGGKQGEEKDVDMLRAALPEPPPAAPASSYYNYVEDEPDIPGLVLKVLMYVGKVKEVALGNGGGRRHGKLERPRIRHGVDSSD